MSSTERKHKIPAGASAGVQQSRIVQFCSFSLGFSKFFYSENLTGTTRASPLPFFWIMELPIVEVQMRPTFSCPQASLEPPEVVKGVPVHGRTLKSLLSRALLGFHETFGDFQTPGVSLGRAELSLRLLELFWALWAGSGWVLGQSSSPRGSPGNGHSSRSCPGWDFGGWIRNPQGPSQPLHQIWRAQRSQPSNTVPARGR